MSFSSSDLTIKRSGFYKCSSTVTQYSAGGIVVLSSNSISLFNICFFNCSCYKDPPAIQIAPHHSNSIPFTEMNHSSFNFNGYLDSSNNYGEMIGGSILYYNYNNLSNEFNPSATHGSGLTISKSTSLYTLGNYSQIINSYGRVFIGFMLFDSNYRNLNNWNFINNSCFSNVWIYHELSSLPPYFESCNFYQNSNCLTNNAGGIPTFSNCQFSSDLSPSNRIGNFLENNNYNLNTIVLLNILNTFLCWNRGISNDNLIFSIPNFININFNIINIFLSLINLFNYEI